MSGRGRSVTFPDVHAQGAAADLARIVQTSDLRRFRVRVDGGGQLLVDLSSWPLPAFSAAIAPLLQNSSARWVPHQSGALFIARCSICGASGASR